MLNFSILTTRTITIDSYFVLLLLVIVDNSQGKYADHVRCKILEKKKKDKKKHGLSFHQTQNNSVQIIDSWLRNDIKKKDKKKKKKTRCTILLENVNK